MEPVLGFRAQEPHEHMPIIGPGHMTQHVSTGGMHKPRMCHHQVLTRCMSVVVRNCNVTIAVILGGVRLIVCAAVRVRQQLWVTLRQ
jgi:hypothetical protein